MEIIRKTRGSEVQRHQQRVFLYCHSYDIAKRDVLIDDLLSQDAGADCVVSCLDNPDEEINEIQLEQELRETSLLVLIVSKALLGTAMTKEPLEVRIAKRLKLPILPIALDSELFPAFTKLMGAVHGIAINDEEYRINLKAQLDNFIVPDELLHKILNDAFSTQMFLSYRKKDIDEARKFMETFHGIHGLESTSIWYDNFLTAGRVFDSEIRASIDKADAFVLLVTPNIAEPGNYVLTEEYPYAVKRGKRIIAVEVVSTDKEIFEKAYGQVELYIPIQKLEETLFERFPLIAKEKNLEAEQLYLIGMAYIRGIAVERNVELGLSVLQKIAVKNDMASCDAAVALGDYNRTILPMNYEKALKWYTRAAEINEKLRGKTSPDLAGIYNYISTVYRDMGKKKESLDWEEKSLHIREMYSRKDDPRLAVSYNNIGSAYTQIKQYKKALEMLERSLEIMQATGLGHPYLNSVYVNLASANSELQNKDKALEYDEKALEVCLKAVGEEHESTANVYNNLGYDYFSKADFDKAFEAWNKALDINKQVLGYSHPHTEMTRTTISRHKKMLEVVPPGEADKIFKIALVLWSVASILLWWWALSGKAGAKGFVFASIATLCLAVSITLNVQSRSKNKKKK